MTLGGRTILNNRYMQYVCLIEFSLSFKMINFVVPLIITPLNCTVGAPCLFRLCLAINT